MTRPVHRFPGNPAGRLLLVLVLVCPQVWTWTLLGQDGSSDTYGTAYGRGYGDGRRSGESDRAARHYYDLANKRDYQRLDPGFDPERDDPEVYRNAYRRGFEAGYDEGYYPDRRRSRRGGPASEPDGPESRAPAAAAWRRCSRARSRHSRIRSWTERPPICELCASTARTFVLRTGSMSTWKSGASLPASRSTAGRSGSRSSSFWFG